MKLIANILLLFILISCSEPQICDNCQGKGKITTNYDYKLTYEVLQSDWKQNSFLNFFKSEETHELIIELQNTSKDNGEFTVKVNSINSDSKLNKKLTQKENLKAGDTKEFKFTFKTNKKPDDFEFKVIAPKITKTETSTCNKCEGSGKI